MRSARFAVSYFSIVSLIILFASLLAFSACRGQGLASLQRESDDSAPGLLESSLPALAALPDLPRSTTVLGPGWTPIDPLDKSHKIMTNGCSSTPAGELKLTGSGSTAFALFAVPGFDGDCFPTSLRITLSAPATGQYLVAVSNYARGCWCPIGPFNNSAEAQIPWLDGFTSPSAFTSSQGCFWFVVLTADGDAITIQSLEVGVDGGDEGPRPPQALHAVGGATGLLLTWEYSPDYHEPDFAGYYVERAPLLSGSFGRLNSLPTRDPYFHDSAAVPGESYRYRICAVDASNNLSSWISNEFAVDASADTPPMPVVRMPDGPLFAPAIVNFDMSGSFDPDGDPITGYEIMFGNAPAPLTGPGPVFTTVLEPGCYVIKLTAETALNHGETYRTLKVYPRWRTQSFVVRDPDAGYRRLIGVHGFRDPDSGQISLYGQDGTYPGFARWLVPDPPASDPAMLPNYSLTVSNLGEPISVNGTVLIPVSFTDDHEVAIYAPGEPPQWGMISDRNADSAVALAADPAGAIWALWSYNTGLTIDLKICSLMPGADSHLVAVDITALHAVDAVYNAAQNAIDIVYADSDSTEWVRWDPLGNLILDSGQLAATASDWVDVEICPDTGLPMAAYYFTARYRTRQLDALDVWSPETLVDGGPNNNLPGDLAFAPDGSTPEIFFGTALPQSYLYEYSGGVWNIRNTVSYATDSGHGVALLPGDSGRDMIVADGLDDERVVLAQLNADGSDSILWQAPGGDGQGLELQSAAAVDGLHVGWKSYVFGVGRHYSSPDGETWADEGSSAGFVYSLDMASTMTGELYMSCNDGANSNMYWWDGTDWQLRASIVSPAQNRPFFGTRFSDAVDCFAYEPATTTLHHFVGKEPGPYPDTLTMVDGAPIWDGAANLYESIPLIMPQVFAEASGGSIGDGVLGFYNVDAAPFNPFINCLLKSEDVMNCYFSRGRILQTAAYFLDELYDGYALGQAYWSTFGETIWPIRYEELFFHSPQLTELDMGMDIYSFSQSTELRRTVSAQTGNGLTAVAVIANFDGNYKYMEWSDFGHWEELPLPDIPHMSAPDLLVGQDGRWHIIYKDYSTDQIMCRSTVAP